MYPMIHTAFFVPAPLPTGILETRIFGLTKLFSLYLVLPSIKRTKLPIIWAGGDCVNTRKLKLGNRNLIGARVTQARLAKDMKQVELLARLQLAGVDMSIPALSLLEGQKRPVSDIELNALADILDVTVDWLLGRGN